MGVITCGLNVTTKIGNIKAIIIEINISFDLTLYKVAYFCNGEYRTVYLNRIEFTIDELDTPKIGL